jgi:hypothetical protein
MLIIHRLFIYIFTIVSDSRRGFVLEVGFIDHFHTKLVTTSNYIAIANFRTSQINITKISIRSLLQSSLDVSW